MPVQESEFIRLADQELHYLQERLELLADENIDDIDLLEGILYIKLRDSSEYVINKHYPSLQIWVSSPISGGYHFSYIALKSGWWTLQNIELRNILSKELGIQL